MCDAQLWLGRRGVNGSPLFPMPLTDSNSNLKSFDKKIESGQKSSFKMICDCVILVVVDFSFEHAMKILREEM